MAYIANKPVHFDRDYKVGEVIPDEVIAPGMTRKLVEMGRILCVDLPQGDGGEESPGQPQETAPDGESGGEFVCEVCGRTFKSQNALAAHSRSHKD